MLRGLLIALAALIGLAVVIAVGGYVALKRPDIAYQTLASRYETPASRYLDLPSGVRMHYRDDGPQDAPVLVLVHGFTSSLHTWTAWIERLDDAYRLVSIDLPGHGLTSAPAGYHGSIETLREAAHEFVGAYGLERFAIAGSSMGGNVAWEYALAHPDGLDGLILVDASGWEDARPGVAEDPSYFALLRNPVLGPMLTDLDNTQMMRAGLGYAYADNSMVDDALVGRYVEFSRAPGHRAIQTRLMLDYRGRNYATAERLAPLAMPVLILHGSEDVLVPPEHASLFHEAIAGAQLVMLEGVGHVPQEEAPDASAAAVRGFLDAIHGRRAEPATQ